MGRSKRAARRSNGHRRAQRFVVTIADEREIRRLDAFKPLRLVLPRFRVLGHALGDLEPRAVERLAFELLLEHAELILVDVFIEPKK